MKTFVPFTMLVLSSTVFFSSCKKEALNEQAPVEAEIKIVDGRLSLDSRTFDSTIKNAKIKKNPALVYQLELINQNSTSNFISLTGTYNKGGRTVISPDTLVDSLVPDNYFAGLLNENREIQVDNYIVKVTNEGTYYCLPNKYQRLLAILLDSPRHGNSDDPYDLAGDSKLIEEGIFFYDSFAGEKVYSQTVVPGHSTNANSLVNRGARVNFDYLPTSTYNSFETHSYGANTVAGKIIQGIIGRNEAVTISIGDDERMKVNFYNISYGIFSSIGIRAQAQHKTWIGWGGNLNVQEIRMGWEGLAIEFPIERPNVALPTVTFEKLKLNDFNINIASFNFISDINNGLISDGRAKQIADALDGKINETFTTTIKKVYDFSYQTLAYQQYNWQQQYTNQMRLQFPDKMRAVLGRYEEVENNAHTIDKNFDWNTAQFTLSSTGGGFHPGIGSQAKKYDIIKASIYACVNRGGQWRGVRIVKN